MTRLRRMVEQVMRKPVPNTYEAGISKEEAIALLEREHRAIVRLVRRLRKELKAGEYLNFTDSDAWVDIGYKKALDDVLAGLEKRR